VEVSEEMANSDVPEVSRMVRQAVEAGRPYLDEDRCDLLLEAADRGDLAAIHDLLVEGMILLRGLGFTRRLLQEVDSACEASCPGSRLIH
jgi:hypothetical protein